MTTPERRHELHKTVVVGMGVAGSGKSTIAQLLAQQLGRTSIEGYDLHPPQNVAKMAAGTGGRTDHFMPSSLLASQLNTASMKPST